MKHISAELRDVDIENVIELSWSYELVIWKTEEQHNANNCNHKAEKKITTCFMVDMRCLRKRSGKESY